MKSTKVSFSFIFFSMPFVCFVVLISSLWFLVSGS